MAATTDDNKVSEDSVSQQLVVITGASSGIGAACIKPFLRAGHPILMLAQSYDKMKGIRDSIADEFANKDPQNQQINNNNKRDSEYYKSLMFVERCDVTLENASNDSNGKKHSIKSAISECIKNNKGFYVDCLINNAGLMYLNTVDDQPLSDMKSMINVNIIGVLNGLKAVGISMKERKRGTIINISSIAGKKNFGNHTVYCATKFAVQALTEGLRQELAGSNVKVSVICPGAVETNLLGTNKGRKGKADDIVKGYDSWKGGMELGVLRPEDVSDACYFVYNTHPRCCIREIQLAPVNQDQ